MNSFLDFIRLVNPHLWMLSIVILVLAAIGYIYIIYQEGKNNLISKRRRVEMIPSAISTLGVLGTFLGITFGLLLFDSNNLTQSIPELLDGLKTAFFTSIAGMVGSLILSRRVSYAYDKATGGVSDINQAAEIIVKSVEAFQSSASQQAQSQAVFYKFVQPVIQQLNTNIANMTSTVHKLNISADSIVFNTESILQTIDSISEKMDENAEQTTTIANNIAAQANNIAKIKESMDNIEGTTSSIVSSVGNIEESNKSQTEFTKEIDGRIGEMMDHTEAMVSTEDEISQRISTLTDKLHGEVVDIEDKMAKTNILLEKKFDEFAELLKKNNTEALVEVMRRVTEEFQTQMNALISKLVQENFDQLNKSVEKLNTWQQENKEMISSLTAQYKQMATNFENTSTSLNKVKEDTKLLVSDGGKLEKLINSLNEVIVQDEKFKAISSDLQKTADLSKSNMESFDQSTRQLNDWVKKQRNFSDAVAVLIQKLEELNEMRNYASTFWKETKQGMNDAVSIVKTGSTELNQQIVGLNQQFYARLSTTLSELDACIRAIVGNQSTNHR